MSTVRAILKQKRLQLLDFSSRSALLNYIPDSSLGLELINVQPHHVYRGLIHEGQAFTFLSLSGNDESNIIINGARNQEVNKKQLQTPYAAAQLQKRLSLAMHHSQAIAGNEGEPQLFLTVGKLRWLDRANPDRVRQAPLVFLPVSLSRKDVRSPIVLTVSSGEPRVNLALKTFLIREFGIKLPLLDVYHTDGLRNFLDGISTLVEERQGWRVNRQLAHVDFFALSDVAIHEDLDPDTGYLGASEELELLWKSLSGNFAGEDNELAGDFDEEALFDPDQLPHVLHANAEQLAIVQDTLRGVNQAVEATAGTGKTQTITNVIAAALASEKSVLVVCNKTRALKDILQRLESVGLRHFALPLYGHHVGRSQLLGEIRSTQPAGEQRRRQDTVYLESLKRLRTQLDEYREALHSPVRESGVTPFEAYNELVELNALFEDVVQPDFDGSMLAGWTQPRFEAVLQRTRELESHFARIGVPQRHPFWGSKKSIFNASDRPEVQRKCRLAGLALNALRMSATDLAHQIGAPAPGYSEDVIRLVRAASKILEAPHVRGMNVYDSKWGTSMEELVVLIETGVKLKALRARYEKILIPEAWGQKVLGIRQALVAHGTKKTRTFIKEYRQARDSLSGLCRNGLPEENSAQLEAVNAILESQRLEARLSENEELARTLFGRQWKGLDSDWTHLDRVSSWLYNLHQEIAQGQVSPEVLQYLSADLELEVIHDLAKKTAKEFNTFLQTSRDAAQEVAMEDILGITNKAFGRVPFGTLLSLFAHWEKNVDSLQDIVAFNHLAARLQEEGLGDIVHLAITWSEASRHLTAKVLESRYAALLTDAINTRRPIAAFDGDAHNQALQQFIELDTLHLSMMAQRIQQVQERRFDPARTSSEGTLSMARELEAHPVRPLEALMAEYGEALQDVKPIFLMTPGSVAELLNDSQVHFDLVIFDEAGQLSAIEALGGLARGQQVIALGDSRQEALMRLLKSSNSTTAEEAQHSGHRESLLALLRRKGATARALRWILPGRPPALAEWINRTLYDRQLHVLPNISVAATRNTFGLHEIPETDIAVNNGSAKSYIGSIVEAILKHAEHLPGRSIGVVVFSEEEIVPILRELERRRQRDPSFEAFFRAHEAEPFFVKTIDNARGELRDVIYCAISIHQVESRRHSQGMFGGSNAEMKSRVSVLSSMVRRELHVFTDFAFDELVHLEREGRVSQHLVNFLRYVRGAGVRVEKTVVASKFELAIADALRQEGYKTVLGIGSGCFRINIAVASEQREGGYVLGILCDGEQYGAIASARDRDRLIPEMLETQGWNLHRIWSVEWHRNPERELAKLLERLKEVTSSDLPPGGDTITVTSNGAYRSMKDTL